MTLHIMLTDVLLSITVLSCWLGVIGMLRMPEPIQALHYLGLPASVGVIALAMAVLSETGLGSTTLKTGLIAVVLLAINSVVAHATARAFRTRELGHWEPREGDPIEFVPKDNSQRRNKP